MTQAVLTKSLLAECVLLGARARESATAASFALPEAAGIAAWIDATACDPALRATAAGWAAAGASYSELLRLCACAVLAMDARWPAFEPHYRAKVAGELEAMLALWPHVLVIPVLGALTRAELIELRAYPVHPLGMSDQLSWTDGRWAPPAEFFYHDLDHARFKVREDLRALGIEIPDAYHDGTTLDPVTGRHRQILCFALGLLDDSLWARAATRAALARHLLSGIELQPECSLRAAAQLLLFEIVHEKSWPLEPSIIARELTSDIHLAKLHAKVAREFFAKAVDAAVLDALPRAQALLRRLLS